MAAVVGETGVDALKSLAMVMVAFYVTCAALRLRRPRHAAQGWSPGSTSGRLFSYLGREFLLILSTSSSESALPRLIAKMEHAGVDQTTVGVVVPTGYSFNLDGTAIYLTMASLFIAEALGDPLSIGEQISLLVFMVIASKGAAGVTGAGLATLAGGLSSHRPELLDGVGLIVGIDRFMSEARALTNFAGNSVATVLIGTWTGSPRPRAARRGARRRRPVRRGDDARRPPARPRRTEPVPAAALSGPDRALSRRRRPRSTARSRARRSAARLVTVVTTSTATMTPSDHSVGISGTCSHRRCAQCRASLTPMKARIAASP